MTGHEHGLEYIVLNKKRVLATMYCYRFTVHVLGLIVCTIKGCITTTGSAMSIRLYMYIVHVLGLIVKTKGVLSLYEYYDQQKLSETLHAIDMDTT